MKKVTCPTCGQPMASDELFCPRCGAAVFQSDLSAAQPSEKADSILRKLPMQTILPVVAVAAAVIIAIALGWDNIIGLLKPSDTTPQLATIPSTQATTPSTKATTPSTKATLPSGGSGYIPPTQAPTSPPLVLPTETAPVNAGPDLSWSVTVSSKMSYEEYFSENRPIPGGYSHIIWTADDGNTYTINNHLQILRGNEPIYTVPGADQLSDDSRVVTADGTYVYIVNKHELLQVELLTGAVKNSFSLAVPFFASALGPDLIYFTGSSPDDMLICRFYVPTQTLDILYKIDDAATPDTWFSLSFSHPYSSLGDVVWTMINPEMHFFLHKEMQNPDSKYRTVRNLDFSKYWEDPRLLNQLTYSMNSVDLMQAVYEDTGILPLLKGTYHCADGSYTEDLGIVDGCWFGSSYPHDHWNPEKTEFIAPTVHTDAPTPLAGLTAPTPEMAEQMRSETWNDRNDIFHIDWNHVKNQEGTVVGPPISSSQDLCNTKFYSYYISDSGSIIRLSLDGTVTEIYTAQNGTLKWLSYEKGILVFVDGDTAMALDVVDCTVRRLVSHPGLRCTEWDLDENGKIYFETVLGMQVDVYLLDPATGKLQKTTYQL